MGFIGDMFGGSQNEQSQRPVETTPKAFKELQQPIADLLKSIFGGPGGAQQGGTGGGAFTGVTDPSRFTAGMGAGEQNLLNQLQGLLGGGGQPVDNANSLLNQTLGGQFLSPDSNPFLQSTIQAAQRPLLEQFQDVTMPGLQSAFTAAGQRTQPGGSSAFDKAKAIESRGLFNALGDIGTKIAGENFEKERARQVQAVTQAGQLSTQQVQNTIQGLQAAALPRLIEQFGIDKGLAEFNQRIDTVLKAIQLAQGLPLFAQGQEGSGSGSTDPDIGSALATGAAMFFAASSRDFKYDEAPAGAILDAVKQLPVQSWRYREEMGMGDERHVGPYAEDWQALLGLGDGKSINIVDAVGVLLQSVKDLAAEVDVLKGERDAV